MARASTTRRQLPLDRAVTSSRSSILLKLSSWPSDLVMWSRPAWSRNASFIVSFVTPSVSCRSTDSTASASGHPSNSHVCDGPGRRLDLQVGSPKRALGSVFGHEDDVVVPPDAQVDRALRHLTRKWSEPFAHMLRLRQYVEDEFDRSVELSSGENLEIAREFDDCRSVPLGVTAALLVVGVL